MTKVGKQFGKLTVTSIGVPGYYLCSCSCGTSNLPVSSTNLQPGKQRSCGCTRAKEPRHRHEKTAPGEMGFRMLLSVYKSSAKKRKKDWALDEQTFRALVTSNCIYCNQVPKSVKLPRSPLGTFVYNGIDRVNNALGYLPSNCVPCCKTCNFAKHTMTQASFLEWMDKHPNSLTSLLDILRSKGVTEFSDGRISMKLLPGYEPSSHMTSEAIDKEKHVLGQADLKQALKEAEDDLFWSAK